MAGHDDHGKYTEDAVRHFGAIPGVPDFVYLPAIVSKGQATREVADGLLIAGQLGAILQVKSRDPVAGLADADTGVKAVLERMLAAALRQAEGSRREIAGDRAMARRCS